MVVEKTVEKTVELAEKTVEKTVELARTIGLKTLVILSLSSMLGSGLFLLPAFAQEVAGPGMWFAFLLAGSVVIASAYLVPYARVLLFFAIPMKLSTLACLSARRQCHLA